MKVAYLQCETGLSGDMLVAALVDAGAPLAQIQQFVDDACPEPVRLRTERVRRHGLAALRVHVEVSETSVTRTWPRVRELLYGAGLPELVRDRALDVFARLARAEATAHAKPVEEVHFHEVGALDSLADVVAGCAALHLLGVDAVYASPVALGTGTVSGQHGLLPVPAPATSAILAEAGLPVRLGAGPGEMCTPTGAALLAAHARPAEPPPGRIVATGAGAGTRDPREYPNALRIILLEADGPGPGDQPMLLMESNVDDLDPRLWPHILDRLLAAGAADAWLTPVLMKKGRPAHVLSLLARPEQAAGLRRVVFAETTSIGLRESLVARHALGRRVTEVEVRGAVIRVKVAGSGDEVLNVQPEYEDVCRVARESGVPAKVILAEAVAAATPAARAAAEGSVPGR